MHERVIIISIETKRVPHLPNADRLAADDLGHPADGITEDQVSYLLSQMTIVPTDAPGMSSWRKKLFLTMAHNAANPAGYFGLPNDRTVTMGEAHRPLRTRSELTLRVGSCFLSDERSASPSTAEASLLVRVGERSPEPQRVWSADGANAN
jgi:hypothetical protein